MTGWDTTDKNIYFHFYSCDSIQWRPPGSFNGTETLFNLDSIPQVIYLEVLAAVDCQTQNRNHSSLQYNTAASATTRLISGLGLSVNLQHWKRSHWQSACWRELRGKHSRHSTWTERGTISAGNVTMEEEEKRKVKETKVKPG